MKAALVLAAFVVLTSFATAQPASDSSPEREAVIANDRAYEEAFGKGDAKTLAAFFAEDAEYTSEDGSVFKGRAEIKQAIQSSLRATPGAKLAIHVDTVRVLASGVVLEKGWTTVTAKDGDSDSGQYTVIYVKKGDQWEISQLVESPLPHVPPHDRLSELAWLIGDWEDSDKASEVRVHSQYIWARGGNFITRNLTVKRGDDTVLEGWQIIGWDPVEERIHSWTFDGEGGFSQGLWTRDGNRWLVRESGVNPDGGRITADETYTKLSEDRISWQSNNRTLDGEPQPSIDRVEIVRVKGK